ncbi:MAG: hypothetical protein AB7Q00_16255 [Phycisphaerales bacterium]
MAAVKTMCPVSRDEFRTHAKPLKFAVGETVVEIDPKEFSTGSLGWNANMKISVMINGKRVACQVGANITIVGSKDLPQ